MSDKRCNFCRKTCKQINDSKRCTECDKEFKNVVDKIMTKYDGALKGLAKR